MAIRPARKNALSTRPVYLPLVPSKALAGVAAGAREAGGGPQADRAAAVLYTDLASAQDVNLQKIVGVLDAAAVEERGDFFASVLVAMSGTVRREAVAAAANDLAWARIRAPGEREFRMLPLRGEIDNEMARLHASLHPGFGNGGRDGGQYGADILYDGEAVQSVYKDLLGKGRKGPKGRVLVVTDRRLAAWNEAAALWTVSAAVAGAPVVVSIA